MVDSAASYYKSFSFCFDADFSSGEVPTSDQAVGQKLGETLSPPDPPWDFRGMGPVSNGGFDA